MTEPRTIFDRDKQRWNADDYRMAMQDLPDKLLNFSFLMITRRMVISPAYLSLSPRASKLLMCCINNTWVSESYRDRRNTNKHIPDTPKQIQVEQFTCPYSLAMAFGVGTCRNQIKAAFDELKLYGFIRQVGKSWYNRPNVYEHVETYLSLSLTDCKRIQDKL